MAPSGRRRQAVLGVFRSLAASVVLVAVYYLLPLDHLAGVPLAVILITGVTVLLAVAAWQLRLILRARYPGLRAGEALATAVPPVPAGVRLGLQAQGVPAAPAPPPDQSPAPTGIKDES
jgi:hypothetical protein